MPNYWASFHMFTSQLDILFYKSACLNCLHILNLGLSVFFLLICRNLLYILRYACFISCWFFFALLKTTLNLSDLKQRFFSAHSSMTEEFYKHSSGKFVPDPQLWCLGMEDLLSRQLLYSFIWSLRPLTFPSYGDLRVVYFLDGGCLPRDRKQSCKCIKGFCGNEHSINSVAGVVHGIGTDSGRLEKQILSLHGAASHMADEQVWWDML